MQERLWGREEQSEGGGEKEGGQRCPGLCAGPDSVCWCREWGCQVWGQGGEKKVKGKRGIRQGFPESWVRRACNEGSGWKRESYRSNTAGTWEESAAWLVSRGRGRSVQGRCSGSEAEMMELG